MRHFLIKLAVILMAAIFVFPQWAGANSGPTYWEGYPSSGVLAVEEDCPVEVASEKLVYDFSEDSDYQFSLRGKVTASYNMLNPTEQDISVQMAFPFISTLDDFSEEDIAVTVDGEVLPYELYAGDVVRSYGEPGQPLKEASFDFDHIVSTITRQPYQAQNFTESEEGTLYRLKVEPTNVSEINLAVSFTYDKTKTKVITNGFNGYTLDGQNVKTTAWCYGPRSLEIFVLGEDIDFSVSAYSDGALEKETDQFTYQVIQEEKPLKTYVMDKVKEYQKQMEMQTGEAWNELQDIGEDQLYNLYASALDTIFTNNMGVCDSYFLFEQNHYERIMTLVYNVDFPAKAERDVSVSYLAPGTMDRTETVDPVYTFSYILNPARNWSSFENLTVEIIAPEEAPYVVDSSIELQKEKDRHYIASLETLPEKDFTFSLYSEEKITLVDRTYGALKHRFGYFTPFVIGLGVIVVLIIAGVVFSRYRKRRASEGSV